MKKIVVTLSLGENYTKDYTLRLIDDVLNLSNMDLYITTDCPQIIKSVYPYNERIKINEIKREDYKISLPIGINKISNDFNFNLRHICLLPVLDLDNTIIIFTDCDNSFDWYNEEIIDSFINENYIQKGYDFFGPRNDYKWSHFLNEYKKNNDGIFKHKLFNYELDESNNDWYNAPLPAEYLLIFINNNNKLTKFYNQWKYFYEFLNNKEYTEGTWAEGFEIGVSSLIAGFIPFDIGWNHPIWSKMFVANGYKSGHRGNIHHKTER
jgi:hypothetical protein